MNEFNLFPFLNKIIKDVSRITNPQNTLPRGIHPAPNPFEAQPRVNIQNVFSQTVDFYSLQAQNMEWAQLLSYMKESLNLPKEIKDLIAQTLQAQGFSKESLLGSKFDFSVFAKILNANTKEATQKIIQAMAEFSKQGIKDVSQLKELLILIGASVSAAGGEINQAIKNLLLLYLPFLPINPNNKDFDFEINKNPKETGGAEDDCVEILIKTKNYGNMRIVLLKEKNQINIFVQCSEKFPSQMFLKLVETEARNNNIETGISFSTIKQAEDEQTEETKQSIEINNSNTLINSAIMLVSHSVIKIIFEIDNSN